jgi:hypothetical protein
MSLIHLPYVQHEYTNCSCSFSYERINIRYRIACMVYEEMNLSLLYTHPPSRRYLRDRRLKDSPRKSQNKAKTLDIVGMISPLYLFDLVVQLISSSII